MHNSFFSNAELMELGFAHIGFDVHISRKASFYGTEKISVGNHVRIDDFCILSGKIEIRNYVHIAAYSALYGGVRGIFLSDFANISSRVGIYACSDDYSGQSMTGPMVPNKYKMMTHGAVYIGKHVIIGSGSTVFPGVTLKSGCAVGAMSLVRESTDEWAVYAGIPAKKKKARSQELIKKEKQFLNECESKNDYIEVKK